MLLVVVVIKHRPKCTTARWRAIWLATPRARWSLFAAKLSTTIPMRLWFRARNEFRAIITNRKKAKNKNFFVENFFKKTKTASFEIFFWNMPLNTLSSRNQAFISLTNADAVIKSGTHLQVKFILLFFQNFSVFLFYLFCFKNPFFFFFEKNKYREQFILKLLQQSNIVVFLLCCVAGSVVVGKIRLSQIKPTLMLPNWCFKK